MLHKEILQVPSKKAVYPIFLNESLGFIDCFHHLKSKKKNFPKGGGVCKGGGAEKGTSSQNGYLKTHWHHLLSD